MQQPVPAARAIKADCNVQCRLRLVPPALLRLLRWACGPPKPGLPLQFKPVSLLTMLNANSAAVAHDNSLPHVLPLTKLQFQTLALQGLAVSELPPHWSTTWIATLHPHRLERCACIDGEYSLSASAGSGVGGACSICRQDNGTSRRAVLQAQHFSGAYWALQRSPASITSGSAETFAGAAAGTTATGGAAACSRCRCNSRSGQHVPSRRTAMSSADLGWCPQLCFGCFGGLVDLPSQDCHFSSSLSHFLPC